MAEETDGQRVEVGHDVVDDFIAFLEKYGIIGLAIAVIMGNATTDLVNAVVASVIMPIIEVVLPGESWRDAIFAVGPVEFGIGQLIGALLDFLIIALIVYLFVKMVLGQENVENI
jgi:large conductance mechanosensitive channel